MEKGTSVVAASRECSCPTAAGSGLPFPTRGQSRSVSERRSRPVPGRSPHPLGLWGAARPSRSGMGPGLA